MDAAARDTSTPHGLFLTAPQALELREFELPTLQAGDALVRVAGCGLCHTDIGFYSGSVRTKHDLPLVLGHEIAGVVEDVAGSGELVGRQVLVPAVMPCGACDLCLAGRSLACRYQRMPGNDIAGGFATHIVVPANMLVPLPDDLGAHSLAELSVISDAVTTPYQAIQRACVNPGDLVVVIGIGGIGTYAVQIAQALGAQVAAIDVDEEKIRRAALLGAAWQFNPHETDGRAIKKTLLAESGVSTARWRILEMSGTAAGQELAWSLLPPAGTLGIVGFTMDKVSVRLSNLMALDATAFGNWGCAPARYPAVVDLVLSGKVRLEPFVEFHDLKDGPALFADAAHGSKRAILVP